MRTLIDFAIRAEYARVKALGDDLSEDRIVDQLGAFSDFWNH